MDGRTNIDIYWASVRACGQKNILFNVSLAKIKFDKVVSNPIVLKAWMEIFYFTPPEVSQIELYFVLEKKQHLKLLLSLLSGFFELLS